MPGRAGLTFVLLASLLLVAVVSGAATAGQSRGPKVRVAANGTARASAIALTNRLLAIRSAEAQISSNLLKTASKSQTKQPRTITQKQAMGTAADGPYLFVATTEVKAERRKHEYKVTKLRTKVTRTDRTTGTSTVIFDRENAYALGLVARGGTVAFQDEKSKIAKKKITVESKIYKGGYADASMTPVDGGSIELAGDFLQVCGKFSLLAAVSDKGEPVVGSVDAKCAHGSNTFSAQLELWRADGSRTDLGPLSLDESAPTDLILTGDKLLETNPFESSAAIRDVPSNKLSSLWQTGAATADIGPDGTLAMVGISDSPQFIYTWDGYSEEVFDAAKSDLPKNFPVPAFPKEKHNPDFRMPFVLFPQGNAEDPVLLAASRARISKLKFCGSNLYALESTAKSPETGTYDAFDEVLGGLQRSAGAPYDVQLLDSHGTLVRSLAKTKALTVAGVGCNGDRLLILALQGSGIHAVELGP